MAIQIKPHRGEKQQINALNTYHIIPSRHYGYMGQLDKVERSVIPSHALRKITGGVTGEDINQATPGEYQPIGALDACNRRYGYKLRGNSTKLWANSTWQLLHAVCHRTPCRKEEPEA